MNIEQKVCIQIDDDDGEIIKALKILVFWGIAGYKLKLCVFI